MSYKICALYDLKTSKIILMRRSQVPIFYQSVNLKYLEIQFQAIREV